MQIFIGNDIIEPSRIESKIEKYGNRFLNKVFTKNEISYCEKKGSNKIQSYAARFAAKEATFKAISKHIQSGTTISWKDIEILNENNGRPIVCVKKIDKIESIDISLSHVKGLAIASVIVVFK